MSFDFAFTDSSMETPLRNLLLEAYWKKLLAQDVIAGCTACLCLQQCSQSSLTGEENTEAAFSGRTFPPLVLWWCPWQSGVSSVVCTSQA